MKISRLVLLSFWFLLIFTACEKDPVEEEWINQEAVELNYNRVEDSEGFVESKLQNKVVNSGALKGNFIGNTFTRKLQIYTPPGYAKNGDQQYPVVYLLHGEPFSEKAFIDKQLFIDFISPHPLWTQVPDFPEEGFRLWIDGLINDGIIEPMIIVMPNAATEPYGFSMYSNSTLNGNFEDFIVNDLVEYMDSHYNTIADPSGRAVIGHSQGGYAAFKFGMLHPDVFGTVASHSGLLFVDALFSLSDVIKQENPDGFNGPDPAKFFTSALYAFSAAWSPNLHNPPFYVDLPLEFGEDGNLYPVPEVIALWYQNDVFNLLDYYNADFKSLDGIYLDVGIYDELGTNLAHQPVLAKMDYYNVDYTFETYEGGHHTHMFERLARALEFFSNNME
ncbi:putative esterase [Christiangramia gaetbulicola]|uniref:Putative esterase n=1 Tax=Christiangramia gaetbulicola TaxID=703340 RepID=A0A2T6AKK8_9FLAO|nr:alpha/beta hydrolase-fold protein [Christiangramia gaetbulicola]PTX44354.1 putative esterase [Christiangramia gaetbulicola]